MPPEPSVAISHLTFCRRKRPAEARDVGKGKGSVPGHLLALDKHPANEMLTMLSVTRIPLIIARKIE